MDGIKLCPPHTSSVNKLYTEKIKNIVLIDIRMLICLLVFDVFGRLLTDG